MSFTDAFRIWMAKIAAESGATVALILGASLLIALILTVQHYYVVLFRGRR